MSKPFDYSKWDNIELSDDEDDLHPNIDRESWFRMKHRSRVEREENEEKDKANIRKEMEKATQRIQILQHELNKIAMQKVKTTDSDSDDDDDDDINDKEALQAELEELQQQNQARQKKLDEYEKNKKWNVDNMFQIKEDRSMVNPNAGKVNYTPDGYIAPKEDAVPVKAPAPAKSTAALTSAPKAAKASPSPAPQPKVAGPALTSPQFDTSKEHIGVMATYPDFVEKYADTIELFMKLSDLEQSKDFLLRYGDILLQENAANYLLLASLEDEMNGHHEKMKKTARQSQIITHIAELAKTLKTHPGNVIMPFFARLQQREHLEEFVQAVTAFQEKIVQRAIVKKQEMDAQRQQEDDGPRDLSEIPLEQRLGPGGLDPLEVIESLPQEMVEAFESRSVEALKEVLSKMKPEDAEYHMKRCVDSGLWVANA
ncbi:cell division cycle protein 37 [Fistulifera solaris]|uniref:Hsp90 chaperone protein kinase-targeting subunit n=1 Tax=Fistulifera solaris TaxID=1519565 RepID=A0A1Z5KP96_FISSO|nr:cell division cycle protein 37 [Fistulifera solaris]|eukprot:GAX27945.1 cell division cycle protein 37 [Fistulifera solaris]